MMKSFLSCYNQIVMQKKIFEYVSDFLDNPEKINSQIKKTQLIINNLKTEKLSSAQAAIALNNFLNK